jgi:nucleotide-binding universal stress UspA family protein
VIPEIKKILFATDLSENSRTAFYYAASEATRHGAGMVLLHVLEKAPGSIDAQLEGLFGPEKWHQMQKDHEQNARQVLIGKRSDYDVICGALADFCADANAENGQCSFEAQEILVKQGSASSEILKVATEKGCDLIVLGAHKGLLGKTAVGSVVKAVLHEARVPVLVVPPTRTA